MLTPGPGRQPDTDRANQTRWVRPETMPVRANLGADIANDLIDAARAGDRRPTMRREGPAGDRVAPRTSESSVSHERSTASSVRRTLATTFVMDALRFHRDKECFVGRSPRLRAASPEPARMLPSKLESTYGLSRSRQQLYVGGPATARLRSNRPDTTRRMRVPSGRMTTTDIKAACQMALSASPTVVHWARDQRAGRPPGVTR